METRLPEFLKQYFWDVKFEELNGEKDAEFRVNRQNALVGLRYSRI